MTRAVEWLTRIRGRGAALRAWRRVRRRSAPLFFAGVVGVTCLAHPAGAGGPFAQLAGTWSGKGKVTFEGGKSEVLACTAYYVTRDAGAGLGLAIRCATTSYKTEIRSNLRYANGKLSGQWEERNFNAAGDASGEVTPERISLRFTGAINGSMTILQTGSKQLVSIATSGGGLSAVSIGLSRM